MITDKQLANEIKRNDIDTYEYIKNEGRLEAIKEFKGMLDNLVDWFDNERMNNNIFRETADEHNEKNIEQIQRLIKELEVSK